MRAKVAKRDRGTCRYCGTVDGPFEIDHVVPIALGGSNRIGNLVLACRACNAKKNANVWKPRPLRAHP
jgi:5-methylcytosine-specific restriction endonuclease McrA